MELRNYRLGKNLGRWILAGSAVLALAGCGGDSSSSGDSTPAGGATAPGTGQNQAPQISGSPPSAITVGTPYAFQPSASDADGDKLAFQISNLPAWATFNSASGAVIGTPTSANVGTTTGIVISVSDGKTSVALSPFAIQVQSSPPPPASNTPPTLAGTPPASATAGQAYSFQPSASDPNGNSLTFSIVNQPAWTTFSATTGRLTGTPTVADVGTYANIVIRVSDGTTSTALAAFSIAVTQISTGSATISWLPPTENTDGSTLTDLGGFRIYYGTSATALTQTATITNPGLTSYVVQNLAAATWYFTVRAYATDGAESTSSNIASKTIQ